MLVYENCCVMAVVDHVRIFELQRVKKVSRMAVTSIDLLSLSTTASTNTGVAFKRTAMAA